MGLFEQVYALVRQIPEGRVATYGQVAERLGLKDVRKVGFALHANQDPLTPCHRVVNKEGRVAKHFAFDGEEEQVRRLQAEGIGFVDEVRVDLEEYRVEW